MSWPSIHISSGCHSHEALEARGGLGTLPTSMGSILPTSSELETTKLQLFAAIPAPPPAFCFHGCWSWTQIHVLGAISSLGGGNGEVRRQGWNFPLESCKMQTLRLPNSCTKRQRAEIHFLQRTSHQGIQVQHLPWDTASWKTEEQEKENSSNCFIRGGTFFKAEHESDVIKTQGRSWIERKSPSLHHLAAWI